MKSDQQLDTLLQRAIKEKLKDTAIHILPSQPSWQQIEKAIRDDNKPSRRFRIKHIVWVASLLVTILFITGIPQNTTAFTKLFHILDAWKDDVVRIVSKSPDQNEGEAMTPPPKKEDVTRENNKSGPSIVSLEEARKQLSFPPRLSDDLQKIGYTLTRVIISPNGNNQKGDSIRLEYEGENGYFYIIEERVPIPYSRNKDLDGEVEEIMIGENVGILIDVENSFLSLFWVDEGVLIKIFGNITKSDMIMIAKGLK